MVIFRSSQCYLEVVQLLYFDLSKLSRWTNFSWHIFHGQFFFQWIFFQLVEKIFIKWWNEILESSQYATQQWTGHLFRIINNFKKSIRIDSHLSYQKIDLMSALNIAEGIFSGPGIVYLSKIGPGIVYLSKICDWIFIVLLLS